MFKEKTKDKIKEKIEDRKKRHESEKELKNYVNGFSRQNLMKI